MKTRRNIFGGLLMAAAALLCLTGCKKDDEGEKVTLGVDFEQTAGAQKTYIGNGEKTIYWSTDDSVQVNGNNYLVHDGVVEVALSESGYAAVYPRTAQLNGSGNACTGGTVEIPSVQTLRTDANGMQRLDAPMAARLDSKTGRLLFRNLYAVIKVKVQPASEGNLHDKFVLNSIVVESDKPLSGEENFTLSGSTTADGNLEVSPAAHTGNSVKLVFPTADTIQRATAKEYYLCVMPFENAKLTIKLNGKWKKECSAVTVGRSHLGWTTAKPDDPSEMEEIDYGFKVDADRYVAFSSGNLQYVAANSRWRFAASGLDIIGGIPSTWDGNPLYGAPAADKTGNNTTPGEGRATQSAPIDLFGFGTGNNPTNTSNNSVDYASFTDWGTNNISYGPTFANTYASNTWRTLSATEWEYLLANNTYGYVYITDMPYYLYDYEGNVKGTTTYMCGLALLPAEFVDPRIASSNGGAFLPTLPAQDCGLVYEGANLYTRAAWKEMEEAGAVLLPCAGSRTDCVSVGGASEYRHHQNQVGLYWTSTDGKAMRYENGTAGVYNSANARIVESNKSVGHAVRLVKDLN